VEAEDSKSLASLDWKNANPGIAEVEDAKKRVAWLKSQ